MSNNTRNKRQNKDKAKADEQASANESAVTAESNADTAEQTDVTAAVDPQNATEPDVADAAPKADNTPPVDPDSQDESVPARVLARCTIAGIEQQPNDYALVPAAEVDGLTAAGKIATDPASLAAIHAPQ